MTDERPLYLRLRVPSLDPEWCEWEELPDEGMPPVVSAEEVTYIRPTLDMLITSGAKSMQFVGDYYSVEYCYDPTAVEDEPELVDI